MRCTSCTRQILSLSLREIAGVNIAPPHILPIRQTSTHQRNTRNFSFCSPRALRPSARFQDRATSYTQSSVNDDSYVPFDLRYDIPALNSADASLDLPSPFSIPEPPIPNPERAKVGHEEDPDFEPEIQLQNTRLYNNLDTSIDSRQMQDVQTREPPSRTRRKLRAGQRSHEDRLIQWRERNGIAPPQPAVVEASHEERLARRQEQNGFAPHQPLAAESVEDEVRTETPRASKNAPPKPLNTTTSSFSSTPTNRNIRLATNNRPTPSPSATNHSRSAEKPEKEPWQTQKAALLRKFSPAEGGWNPLKKLSPDALEGIRALHSQYPSQFPTEVLSNHFKVSPEAIRRILKSKWRPNAAEEEDRRERWDRRGERIWNGLVEKGVHPPKRWREMGIGAGGPRRGRGEWLRGVRERDGEGKKERPDMEGQAGMRSLAARIG